MKADLYYANRKSSEQPQILILASERRGSNATVTAILVDLLFQRLALRMHKFHDVTALWHLTNITPNLDHLVVYAKELVW